MLLMIIWSLFYKIYQLYYSVKQTNYTSNTMTHTFYLCPLYPRVQAFLANEDLGDSQDSVEALIKKHEDFEKSLAAQEEKIKALNEFAGKLIENEHYASDDVAARRSAVRMSSQRGFEPLTYRFSKPEHFLILK